jgi:hypothetical protein
MRAYVASGDAYSQFSLRQIISFRLLVSSAGTLHMFAAQSPACFKDSKSTCGEATQIYQTPIAYLKPLNSGRTMKRTNHPQIEVMGCSLPWPNHLPSYIPFLCTTTSAESSWKSGPFRGLIGEYEELAPKSTLTLYSPDTRSQVWLGCIRRPGSDGITLGIRLGSRELSCHLPRGHFFFQGPVKPPLADTNGRVLFSPEMLKAILLGSLALSSHMQQTQKPQKACRHGCYRFLCLSQIITLHCERSTYGRTNARAMDEHDDGRLYTLRTVCRQPLIRRLPLPDHDHLQAVYEITVGSALHNATAALRNGESHLLVTSPQHATKTRPGAAAS